MYSRDGVHRHKSLLALFRLHMRCGQYLRTIIQDFPLLQPLNMSVDSYFGEYLARGYLISVLLAFEKNILIVYSELKL